MLMLSRHRLFLRCVSLLTALTFLPTTVQAWNLMPQVQAVVLAAEEGPVPLAPDKVAELATGEEAPSPLSEEHREQLSDKSAPPLVAPLAPDSPQFAQAEGAATALTVGATPVPGAGGLKALSREELQQATAGPRVITDNPYDAGLPEAADILSRMNSAKQEQEAARVQVAQAGDVPPPTPGQEADAALLAAATLKAEGHYSESIMAYVQVMESYPNDPVAVKQADRGIVQFVKDIKAGTLTREQLAEFETTLETWTPGNVQAGYGALTYLGRRAEEEQDGGGQVQVYQDYARRTINLAARVIVLDPYHYKQLGVTDYYYVSAKRLAPSDGAAAMQALAESTQGLPSSMGRLSANFVLANFEGIMNNNRGMATVYRANLLEDARAEFVQQTFTNPSVEPWLKGMLGNVIGGAYWSFADYDGAIAFYESTLPYMSDAGSTREMVELSIAQAKADKFNKNPEEAVRGFNDFLAKFPNGKRAPQALNQLAAIYMTAGDYHGAADLYSEVVQRWPESEWGKAASAELNYIFENLYDAEPIAENLPPTKDVQELAMRCGPEALARLLATAGVDATADELAALAGTDATGTSMLGLIQAAEKKGTVLSGVSASGVDELKAPFIAYVNGDHFVMVTEVGSEKVSIVDRTQGARTVSRSAFGAMWNGMALTLGDGETDRLEVAELKTTRGGAGTGPVGDTTPPCVTCQCQSNGSPCGGGSMQVSMGTAGAGGGTTQGTTKGPEGGGPCLPGPRQPPKDGASVMCIKAAGCPSCPISSVAAHSPGVNPEINVLETALILRETDLTLPVRGSLKLSFTRRYINEKGSHRGEYTSTAKPWMNNVGGGWTHNLNIHIRTANQTIPDYVSVYDEDGSARTYINDSTSGGYTWYYRHAKGHSEEKGNVLKRNNTTLTYTLEEPDGLVYEFSAATTDSDRFARLEAISGLSGNSIVLAYDGANGTGKLTKATSPTTDYTLNMTYSGALITKVELKKSSTVLNSVQYAYLSNELTKVTDHAAKTVKYNYSYFAGNNDDYGRFITKITDKANRETNFAWAWYEDTISQATKITVTNTAGLTTTYDRSLSNVATIKNWDGATELTRIVNTPVSSGDTARSKYHDYYTSPSTYERWEYQYNASDMMTKILAPDASTYVTVDYNSQGSITKMHYGTGPDSYFYYDSTGTRVTKETDSVGVGPTYHYNGNGLITKVTHPALASAGILYAYNVNGLLTRTTSPLGTNTDYSYDAIGRKTGFVQDPGGLDISSTTYYDEMGNATRITDPRGKDTYYYYGDVGCGGCGGGGQLTKVTDASGNNTEWRYDTNGFLTKTIGAAGVETGLEYDAVGRMTKTLIPAGGSNFSVMAYDLLGQVTAQTDFGGKTTTYAYDYLGRQTSVSDPVGDVVNLYNSLGLLSTVTDSLNHTTINAYDTAYRLTKVTDAIGKSVEYAYDSYGRRTKEGAGSGGSIDPTTYFYSNVTGQRTKVEYTSSPYTANYFYDGGRRLTKLTDWLDNTDGLRYTYDAAGRLTTLTDYDDSELTYTYDDGGKVLSMEDYHGNTTTYTYNDVGQMSTLTAPGSKTWTYSYGVGARLTRVDIPNGMHSLYGYDSLGRQTSIQHKDGGTIKQGFEYAFDVGGSITKITHEDGAYWTYAYDGRERLTTAERGNQTSPTISATYQYTYDAGDNMLSKVGPWVDDFQDGNITGWSGNTANYAVSGGVLKNTLDTTVRDLYLSETDADHDLSFDYVRYSSTGRVDVYLRTIDGSNRLYLELNPSNVKLQQVDGGTSSTLATYTTTVAQNNWYKLRAVLDGTSVKIFWGANGAAFNEIISATTTKTTTSRACYLRSQANSEHGFDNIQLIAGSRSTTETFTYNNANEQITDAKNGVTTTQTYDDWGRLATRDDGTHDATYVYRYGSKLYSSSSDFPGEGNVTYETGGDGKRRSRIAGSSETWYNWSTRWTVLSEEDSADGAGQLNRTYIGRNTAHVEGASPSSGVWKYYALDTLKSSRSVWNGNKTRHTAFEYTAFGDVYATYENASDIRHTYTGHDSDSVTRLHFRPFRYYSPDSGRWNSRDPIGLDDGPNLYAYVHANPIMYTDPMGLFTITNPKKCCGKEKDIENAANAGCANLGKWFTDPDLRACVEKRCKNGKIKCRQRCPIDTLGWSLPFGSTAGICVKEQDNDMENTVMHEWLHTCGYHLQDPPREGEPPTDLPPWGDGV